MLRWSGDPYSVRARLLRDLGPNRRERSTPSTSAPKGLSILLPAGPSGRRTGSHVGKPSTSSVE